MIFKIAENRQVIRNVLSMTGANAIGAVFGFLRGFYIARFLSPADYGIWTLISTLINYSNYVDLGINNGTLLEVPKLIGKSNNTEVKAFINQSYTAILIFGCLISLTLIIISFLPTQSTEFEIASLRIFAAAILVTSCLNYYHCVARIYESFGIISISTVLTALITFLGAIGVGLVIRSNQVWALALVTLFGAICASLLLAYRIKISLTWPLNWRFILSTIKIGLPVTLLPIIFVMFQSIDRWIVASIVTKSALGYYGFGVTMGAFLYIIPNTLAIVLFTKQIKNYGSTNDIFSLESLFYKPLLICSQLMALIAGFLALSMPFLIYYIFPSYIYATETIIIQLVSYCLLFGVPISSNFLVTIGEKSKLFVLLIVMLIFEVVFVFLMTQSHAIYGAAIAVLISDTIYCGLILYIGIKKFGGGMGHQLAKVSMCFIPFVISLFISTIIYSTYKLNGNLGVDAYRSFINVSIYCILCLPLFFFFSRGMDILGQQAILQHLFRRNI